MNFTGRVMKGWLDVTGPSTKRLLGSEQRPVLAGPEEGDRFAPSKASFMVNYRVEDLHALVTVLKAEDCNDLDKIDDSEYGKFARVIDPKGNKVELWQPPAGQ